MLKTSQTSLNFKYPYGEFNFLKDGTAYGEYLNRYCSHVNLLELIRTQPVANAVDADFANDFSLFQQKPLGSTILAMQVVAYEEYLRNIFRAIKNVENIETYFVNIKSVESDKFGDYFNIRNSAKVNQVFEKLLALKPIDESKEPILDDLAVIRDIVFHFWGIAIKRKADQLKSNRYKVEPDSEICLSYTDLVNECKNIEGIVSQVNRNIYKGVVDQVVRQLGDGWDTNVPEILNNLFGIFGYFGRIFTSEYTDGKSQTEIQKLYIDACIAEIKTW